jgi:hypothetical protein
MKENRVPDPGKWEQATGFPILDRADTLLQALSKLFLGEDFVVLYACLGYFIRIHVYLLNGEIA